MADTQNPSPTSAAPSVGRIVHYHDNNFEQPLAGIVTAVNGDDSIDVTVFPPSGIEIDQLVGVDYSERGEDDHWSWPPRV